MMNKTQITLAIALLLAIAVIAAIMVCADDKKEYYEVVNANEGLIGTASFDIADTEHSGSWTKGTVFAIDKGEYILLRIVGEMEMTTEDASGVEIDAAQLQDWLHPPFELVGAYCEWEQKRGLPHLLTSKWRICIGNDLFVEDPMAAGGGFFTADFKSTDHFDRSEGKIDLFIGVGSYCSRYEVISIFLNQNS